MNEAPPSPWFGQPRGLTVLFATNMWERFSYVEGRAILVFYMTKELLIRQKPGLSSNASTAGPPISLRLTGMVADRLLGKRRAIVVGGPTRAAAT